MDDTIDFNAHDLNFDRVTMSFWYYYHPGGSWGVSGNYERPIAIKIYENSGVIRALIKNNTGDVICSVSGELAPPEQWNYFNIRYNGTHCIAYSNKTFAVDDAVDNQDVYNQDVRFGMSNNAWQDYFNGSVDELAIWNFSLSDQDVLELEDMPWPITCCEDCSECVHDFGACTVVTLNSPTDGTSTSDSRISFNCSATDNQELVNISLMGSWNGWKHELTKNVTGINASLGYTKTLPVGEYSWGCTACDNASHCAVSTDTYTFRINEEGSDSTGTSGGGSSGGGGGAMPPPQTDETNTTNTSTVNETTETDQNEAHDQNKTINTTIPDEQKQDNISNEGQQGQVRTIGEEELERGVTVSLDHKTVLELHLGGAKYLIRVKDITTDYVEVEAVEEDGKVESLVSGVSDRAPLHVDLDNDGTPDIALKLTNVSDSAATFELKSRKDNMSDWLPLMLIIGGMILVITMILIIALKYHSYRHNKNVVAMRSEDNSPSQILQSSEAKIDKMEYEKRPLEPKEGVKSDNGTESRNEPESGER